MTNRKQTPKKLTTWLSIFAMIFALGMPMQFVNAQSNVSDIAGHWANEQISNWVSQGIVKGYPDGTFKPNNSITRAEFIVLVNRSFQFKDTTVIDFKDVQSNDWFYEEIAKAKKAGYMGGYEDGTIKPNAPISRQEVATVVAKLKCLYENNSAADKFIDAAKIPAWSKGFIGAVVEAGYMGGYPDRSFQPTKNISRAEAIVVLNVGIIANPENRIIYENENLGFSLKLPENWKDKYIIEESEDSISIFSKKIYKKYNGAGLLLSIERQIGELITEEDMKQAPVEQQIILQGNGYTYFTRMPSDMQCPPDDEELSSEYKALLKQIPDISHSISLLGDQKPKTVNEGFKVVGSSFFTVEIPNDWELKVFEESPLCWVIYAGGHEVGSIDLILYKSEGLSEEKAANSMYLFNDETFREMRIIIDSEYADQSTMRKIKDSFNFVEGPFNVIDLEFNAEQYIAGGGKKVFGEIDGFDMKNEKPEAVRVKVMKFIPDCPEDNNPNGFEIEDLNKTESYSLDFGVRIAPLVAPNYNTYGIYEIPLLDENFIKNYENYKDFFYNFIIGRDGQLKIILGHYIP
jgi:hypothetical protein